MFPRLGFGLGLRPPHYPDVLAGAPRVDWWEVISENFMVAGGNPRRVLRQVRERWPVVLHGVSLSIGSTDPLDDDYLARLAMLVAEVEPAIISDHLCWSRFGGHSAHDLWPVPYTDEALDLIVANVGRVQDRLRRRILLENPSSYMTFSASHIGEAEFLAEVARRADCGILLDVNNVYVSCTNHGWDPRAYFAAIPVERVGQIHLAGHTDEGTHLLDTHDTPVCAAVWALYGEAIARFGAVSSMIERDDDIPPLADLVAEPRGERFVEPQIVPPPHRDVVTEPHVGELVRGGRDEVLALDGARLRGIHEQEAVAEGDRPRVLHGAGPELGHPDEVELLVRIGHAEVPLECREHFGCFADRHAGEPGRALGRHDPSRHAHPRDGHGLPRPGEDRDQVGGERGRGLVHHGLGSRAAAPARVARFSRAGP